MKASDIPSKFNVPWGVDAGGSYIRSIPQTTADSTRASLDLGFPPATATPVDAGGTPPNIADFNGINNQLTAWARYLSAGGPLKWDSAFSAAIGGYPAGAIVANASTIGSFWLCTTDDNLSNPDTGGSGWTAFSVGATPLPTQPGAMLMWPTSTPPTGWLERNGAALSTTTYAALFAVIGYTFGGSGGTFWLPDDRGVFERGWDHSRGLDPGRTFGSYQVDSFASHFHFSYYYDNNSGSLGAGHGGGAQFSQATTSTGDSETRGKNRAYLPIIKY